MRRQWKPFRLAMEAIEDAERELKAEAQAPENPTG